MTLQTNQNSAHAIGTRQQHHHYSMEDVHQHINRIVAPQLRESGVCSVLTYSGNTVNNFQNHQDTIKKDKMGTPPYPLK